MSKNTSVFKPTTPLQQATFKLIELWRGNPTGARAQNEQDQFMELAEALEAELADSSEPVALVSEAQLIELAQCNAMQLWSENPNLYLCRKGDSLVGTPIPPGHVNLYRKAHAVANDNLSADQTLQDTARLDWLDGNIFSRENLDFRGNPDKNYNMWVTFSPKGVQGSARRIIDAAISQQP